MPPKRAPNSRSRTPAPLTRASRVLGRQGDGHEHGAPSRQASLRGRLPHPGDARRPPGPASAREAPPQPGVASRAALGEGVVARRAPSSSTRSGDASVFGTPPSRHRHRHAGAGPRQSSQGIPGVPNLLRRVGRRRPLGTPPSGHHRRTAYWKTRQIGRRDSDDFVHWSGNRPSWRAASATPPAWSSTTCRERCEPDLGRPFTSACSAPTRPPAPQVRPGAQRRRHRLPASLEPRLGPLGALARALHPPWRAGLLRPG